MTDAKPISHNAPGLKQDFQELQTVNSDSWCTQVRAICCYPTVAAALIKLCNLKVARPVGQLSLTNNHSRLQAAMLLQPNHQYPMSNWTSVPCKNKWECGAVDDGTTTPSESFWQWATLKTLQDLSCQQINCYWCHGLLETNISLALKRLAALRSITVYKRTCYQLQNISCCHACKQKEAVDCNHNKYQGVGRAWREPTAL